MRVEKESVERSASRKGVRVEKGRVERRSASRNAVRVEKERIEKEC